MVYFTCKCLSFLCLRIIYAVSIKIRTPVLTALWWVDRKRDRTAVFTNMFSWVNTQHRGTRPHCKQFQPVSPKRRKIFWIHNIWGTLLTGCKRRVCLRCVAVCRGQFKGGKKPTGWAKATFVSCQFSQTLSNGCSCI